MTATPSIRQSACRRVPGLLLCGLLTACAGKNTATPADAALATPQGPWFCEPSLTSGWDCTNDPTLVANPVPSRTLSDVRRLSEPAPEQPAQTMVDTSDVLMTADSPSIEADALPAVEATTQETPTVNEAPDRETARSTPKDTFAELAYRPDQPTSLLELPPNFYAVQLIALSSAAELQRYFDTLGLDSLSAAEVEVDGELRYVLLLGVYEDFETAQKAAASIPEKLTPDDPWIRRLGNLQAAMVRADQRRAN